MPYTTVITFVAYDPLAAADLNSNFSNLDYLNAKVNSQIIIQGGSMISTLACSASEYKTGSYTNAFSVMDFPDNGGYSAAEIVFPMPSDYAGGTITAKLYWTANSTSTNSVVWEIQAVAIADNEVLDVPVGTAQSVTDANKSTAYKLNVTDATSAITIAGTPAAGELVVLAVLRNAGNGSDTLAATARLIAVVITYTRS